MAADDVLINKAAPMEGGGAGAREESEGGPDGFAPDYPRQDAVTLNVQHTCKAAIALLLRDASAG